MSCRDGVHFPLVIVAVKIAITYSYMRCSYRVNVKLDRFEVKVSLQQSYRSSRCKVVPTVDSAMKTREDGRSFKGIGSQASATASTCKIYQVKFGYDFLDTCPPPTFS